MKDKLSFNVQLLRWVADMNETGCPEISWPSGDFFPVLATKIHPLELAKRLSLDIFRAKDDLDWFTGAALHDTPIGPILVMKHDNNPQELTAFYVDLSKNAAEAQVAIAQIFCLIDSEVTWRS